MVSRLVGSRGRVLNWLYDLTDILIIPCLVMLAIAASRFPDRPLWLRLVGWVAIAALIGRAVLLVVAYMQVDRNGTAQPGNLPPTPSPPP